MRPRFAALAAVYIATLAGAQPGGPFLHPADAPPERRFDFWLGQWDVHNRFIDEDGTERTVEAEAMIWPGLGWQVIVEHWRSKSDAWPMRGFSMRTYDPERDLWTIALCWPGDGPAKINLMEGSFRNGRVEFFPASTPEGERPRSRFTFSDVGPNSLRWDMAVPVEGDERAWRTTWVMEWSRKRFLSTSVAELHGRGPGENRALRWLVGNWGGGVSESPQREARRIDDGEVRSILDGRALLLYLIDNEVIEDVPGDNLNHHIERGRERILLIVWDRESERWRAIGMETDGQFQLFEGDAADNGFELTSVDSCDRVVLQQTNDGDGTIWIFSTRESVDDEWITSTRFEGRSIQGTMYRYEARPRPR
ncbi:MAG: hypothetical protein ACF8QF_09900 [Phycisphaerales bacterium]